MYGNGVSFIFYANEVKDITEFQFSFTYLLVESGQIVALCFTYLVYITLSDFVDNMVFLTFPKPLSFSQSLD